MTVNWMILRRVTQPHLGIIIGGKLRNIAIDFLPALVFLNYQHAFKIYDYTFMINYLN